jgi:cobalt-zinc-cadmium efflux system outer membrane protein
MRVTPDVVPCAATLPSPEEKLDLPALWKLTLANNPALREAAANLEAARGRLIQAGKYPNPRFSYSEEELGTSQGPPGTAILEVNQEIVTAGKRRLDKAVARRWTDAASVALLGRKFEVLSRVRRAYYDYLAWQYTVQVNEEVVTALRQGLEITRKQVEEVKTRPRTDLLSLQALLEEAKTNQTRSQVNREAAWRQLAADVGLPRLPPPQAIAGLPESVPDWDADAVAQRVLAANTELKQSGVEAERARLEVDRARAEAVPNVTVGGGYSKSFPEHLAGGIVTVETALPLWDRKQGRIHEAQARWAQAQAAQQTAATRLSRDTAEAFGRYQAARQEVQRLLTNVLPPLVERLALVRKGYQVGSAQITFSDVLLAEQGLNTTRLTLAEARRALWLAIADLQGLMQLDVDEELPLPEHPGH